MIRLLALGALAAAGAFAAPTSAQAVCETTGFASPAEAAYARGVVNTTWGITCLEARNVYRHYPNWRNALPHHWVYTATPSGPSPAVVDELDAEAAYPARDCVIHSRVRAETFLGVWVVHLDMWKDWDYDGWRVYPRAVRTEPYVDASVLTYDGIVDSSDGYSKIGGSSFAKHTSHRIGKFSGSFPVVGGWGANPHAWIWGQYNGDWATPNDTGLADCRDD